MKILLKKLILMISLSVVFSCNLPDNMGFYQPITMRMIVPDGTPEFKAGWYAGCKTALGVGKNFANGWVYDGPDFGSGVYQHDPVYQSAWTNAYFNCVTHTIQFNEIPFKHPLE